MKDLSYYIFRLSTLTGRRGLKPYLLHNILLFSVIAAGFLIFQTATYRSTPPIDDSKLDTSTESLDTRGDWLRESLKFIQTNQLQIIPTSQNELTDKKISWRAVNRSGNARFNFTVHSLRIDPTSVSSEWYVSFSLLSALGEDIKSTAEVSVHLENNRINFLHPNYSEWYVNSELGVEHGFTITSLDGVHTTALFRIAVKSDLSVSFDSINEVVTFKNTSGKIITSYSKLLAFDAQRKKLPTRLDYSAGVISLIVDTHNAELPITIDPIVEVAKWQGEGLQAGEEFGASVAGVGDVNGDGLDDVAIAAPKYSDPEIDEGAVFVFLNSKDGLLSTTTAEWIVQSDQAGALFGSSVSGVGDLNGDTFMDIIVGSPNYSKIDPANPGAIGQEGAAFIYYGSANGLSQNPRQIIVGDLPGAHFGFSVAGAGDVDNDSNVDVVIGAPNYSAPELDEGRVYIYRGSPTGLDTVNPWLAESNQAGAQLGFSVSGAGHINADSNADIIVGAVGYDYTDGQGNVTLDTGAAFVYFGSSAQDGTGVPLVIDASISPLYRLMISAGARSGVSVASAGDVNGDTFDDIIFGADNYNFTSSVGGVAAVMYGPDLLFTDGAFWFEAGGQSNAQFGISVAGLGDINGDGFDDIAVGANNFNGPTASLIGRGRVSVYQGSPNGISTLSEVRLGSRMLPMAQFGRSVAAAGDINADGYMDLLVGAPAYSKSLTNSGAAFIHEGRGLADLSITMTASLSPVVNQGTILTYAISVASTGPDPAHKIHLVVTLPKGAGFIEAIGPSWVCAELNLIVDCYLSTLPPRGASSLSLSITPPSGISITTADIYGNVLDTALANNSVTLQRGSNTRPVANSMPDLSMLEDTVFKVFLDGFDADGDDLNYSANFSNLPLGSLLVKFDVVTGTLVYTPPENFFGEVFFTYTVQDATKTSLPGKVVIQVLPVNDKPFAEASVFTTSEDVVSNRTLQFHDPDSADVLTLSIVSPPEKGELILFDNKTGDYEYKPIKNVNGKDFFTFKVNDGFVDSTEARISINIDAVNDAPEVLAQILEVNPGESISGTLAWSDVDSDAVTLLISQQPNKGRVSLDSETGAFTYTALAEGRGSDSFRYTATDGDKVSLAALVSIRIGDNRAPSAPVLIAPTDGENVTGSTVTFDWKASTDSDGDKVSYLVYYCNDINFSACDGKRIAQTGNPLLLLSLSAPATGLFLFGIMLPAYQRRKWLMAGTTILLILWLSACSNAADEAGGSKKPTDLTFLNVNALEKNTQYYWKVVAQDEAGATSVSDVWSFQTGGI
ncbi:MAG: tandem-95 repeat protein [Thiohalomonadales bacterium]